VLIVETGPTGLAPSTVLIVEQLGMGLLATFGSRMAAVFVLSVTSVGMRTRLVPRWMVAIGYAVALVLLLSPPVTRWSQLLFPSWVLLLSVYFLVAAPQARTHDGDG
jgi:hypothetical protein